MRVLALMLVSPKLAPTLGRNAASRSITSVLNRRALCRKLAAARSLDSLRSPLRNRIRCHSSSALHSLASATPSSDENAVAGVTSERPASRSERPVSTWKRPGSTTERPFSSSESPVSTSERPASTSPPIPIELAKWVAKCPDKPPPKHLPCSKCRKIFTSERSLKFHSERHTPRLAVQCDHCDSYFPSPKNLRAHAQVHTRRKPFVCPTCGDEFKSKRALNDHLKREPGEHTARRLPLQLNATHMSASYFSHSVDVIANRLCHVTTPAHRKEIDRCQALVPGPNTSDRVHDGPVRLEDAPPISFGYVPTSDNALHTLTFHSVFAEPGELTSILALDLNTFVRTPGEYRMFFAAVVRSDSSRSAWRVTVLFVRADAANSPVTMGSLGAHRPGNVSDLEWAEKHLVELDPFDNPLFYADPGSHQWNVATRFHPTGDGVSGPLSLVVGVARGLSLAEDEALPEKEGFSTFSALSPCWIDGSKVARIGGQVFCPSCDIGFTESRDLFAHHLGNTRVRPSTSSGKSLMPRPPKKENHSQASDSQEPARADFVGIESVIENSCFAYLSTALRNDFTKSSLIPGTKSVPEPVLKQGEENMPAPNDSSLLFEVAPNSEGQIFRFSTHPRSAQGGEDIGLLEVNLSDIMGKNLHSGERKVFTHVGPKRQMGFFRYCVTQVLIASEPFWDDALAKGYREVTEGNPVLYQHRDSKDWLVSTHVKDSDGKLALSKLRISFTDDLDLSELRHEWRDAVKLQTTRYRGKWTYLCPVVGCSRADLRSTRRVREHYRVAHGPRRFQCSDCTYAATSRSNLNQHVSFVHNFDEPRVPCSFEGCHKTFKRERTAFNHERRMHGMHEAVGEPAAEPAAMSPPPAGHGELGNASDSTGDVRRQQQVSG